ncbi:MAG: sodium:solute symporter family protein [Burkholderiaceae bacterium]
MSLRTRTFAPARSRLRPISGAAFSQRLHWIYLAFGVAFVLFVAAMAGLERLGLPRPWIGFLFLVGPVAFYAGIGILSRTTDPAEYYVAGRRVPALYNGMATGADWMSAASFIGMTGTLYLSGYGGLAYTLGWTGGFVLVALLIAPYLRKFGQYTIPDFLAARYEGNLVRVIGVVAAIGCSFLYVVAQIYGVGLITSRITGVAFEVGVFLGLGGILVCSFLGGMRAVTWTQVAQCIVLLVAFLVPVAWLSLGQGAGVLPQASYGYQLQQVIAAEKRLQADPAERQVMAVYRARAAVYDAKLADIPAALAADRRAATKGVADLKAANAPQVDIQAAERALARVPRDVEAARDEWTHARDANLERARPLAGMPPHEQAFAGDPHGDPAARRAFDESRRNFLALVFCLMVGTASLPHVLTRFYTTPSVPQARASVAWSLFFILLLYVTAPALAVLLKVEILQHLVGTRFDRLPAWINNWAHVDPSLLQVADVNGDGVLQLGELHMGGDVLVLATPEIAGQPYVMSALIAAGGIAAALSTADGLLLTIANALSHDLLFRIIDPGASSTKRVTVSKVLLLMVALGAAWVTAQKPGDILLLVSAAFSIAASAFFPALVLGVFWKRANRWGAAAGMLAGLGITLYYTIANQPGLRESLGFTGPVHLWWSIQPIAAGLFGVPAGFATMALVSLATPRPSLEAIELVDRIRVP